MTTPQQAGFAMPAEWHPHTRCWMAWPCRTGLWGDKLEGARAAYADVARAVAEFEPVTMVCRHDEVVDASLLLGKGVDVLAHDIDDSWMRDTGPSFLIDGQGGLGAVHWRFNGYGGKYPDHANDAEIGRIVAERARAQVFTSDLVLEGGAVHVDGEGTALVVETAVLNANRNPGLTRADVDRRLFDLLGVERVIWLPEGHEDDETDGHVDVVACFARPGVVIALASHHETDPMAPVLRRNIEILKSAEDARGRRLEVVTVPAPARRRGPDGRRLVLSYINFYLANGAVILPTFRAPEDHRAVRVLHEVFEGRQIVQIDAADIVLGGGVIHCITQQQPAA